MSAVDTADPGMALAPPIAAVGPAATGSASERSLLCRVGNARFAIPIAYLRGIEPHEGVTPVPQVPPWVEGVTNLRGTVVGVVDLARFLGLPDTEQSPNPAAAPLLSPAVSTRKLVLCGLGGRLVAFSVADTENVVDYPAEAVLSAGGVDGRIRQFVSGLVPTDGKAAPLLDIEQLLSAEELVRS